MPRAGRLNHAPAHSFLALAAALGVECTAFTQEPSELRPPKPGRPKKAEAAGQGERESPGRGKGRTGKK
jgi:hypothetical protein